VAESLRRDLSQRVWDEVLSEISKHAKPTSNVTDVDILYSRAVIQRTIDVSLAFLEHGSAEKVAV
jgi:hypothetical protein